MTRLGTEWKKKKKKNEEGQISSSSETPIFVGAIRVRENVLHENRNEKKV